MTGPDLGEKIRERLDDACNNSDHCLEGNFANAIRMLLDRHRPVVDSEGPKWATCAGCETSSTFTYYRNCDTVRTIATALGVEP